MKTNYIDRVLRLFFTHSYASPMKEKVQQWLVDDTWTAEKYDALQTLWNQILTSPNESTDQSLKRVNDTIKQIENRRMQETNRHSWLRYAAIALLLFSVCGGYFFFKREVKMITVSTANKQQKECILPDGTTILLNAGSQLMYPSRFDNHTRKVRLEGEAFFTVTRDTTRPFIVQTSTLSVKVLGTQFNISAYPANEKATATLNSGSVQVFLPTGEKESGYILKPDQQFIYNKTDRSVRILPVVEEAAEAKEGRLIFQNAAFQDILRTLERRFNIEIVYDKRELANRSYTVKFLHGESLENILHVLQDLTDDFDYRIEGRRVTLVKKGGGENKT